MNEAVVFLAIGHAGGCYHPVSRQVLIDMTDAMNHRLSTDEELREPLSTLTAAGLVGAGGDDLGLTDLGCSLYREVTKPPHDHSRDWLDAAWSRSFPPGLQTEASRDG